MKLKRYRELMIELGFEFNGFIYSIGDFRKDSVTSRCHKLGNKSPNWNGKFYMTRNGSFATKYNRVIYIHTHDENGFKYRYEQNLSNVTEEELIKELSGYLPSAKQMIRQKRLNKILT